MSCSTKYKVSYKIVGFDGVKETEEYDLRHIAEDHLKDIAGFEGIYNAHIVDVETEEDDDGTAS